VGKLGGGGHGGKDPKVTWDIKTRGRWGLPARGGGRVKGTVGSKKSQVKNEGGIRGRQVANAHNGGRRIKW